MNKPSNSTVAKCFFAILLIWTAMPVMLFTIKIVGVPLSAQSHRLDANQTERVKTASLYINEFSANNSRLPTPSEFQSWMADDANKHLGYEGWGFSYYAGPFSDALIEKLGKPPKGAFVLEFWGGDDWLAYASWFGDDSVIYVPDSAYFIFGSKIADTLYSGQFARRFFA